LPRAGTSRWRCARMAPSSIGATPAVRSRTGITTSVWSGTGTTTTASILSSSRWAEPAMAPWALIPERALCTPAGTALTLGTTMSAITMPRACLAPTTRPTTTTASTTSPRLCL